MVAVKFAVVFAVVAVVAAEVAVEVAVVAVKVAVVVCCTAPPSREQTTQEWTNRTLAVHERTSVHFLVLPGSLLSITEITEYRYFSPLKPIRELSYTSE